MYSILYTIGMVLLWVINLFNGTGLGMAYKTTELAMLMAVVIAIVCVAFRLAKDGDILVQPRYFYVIIPLVLVFAGTSILQGYRLTGLESLWPFLLVYILSFTRPNITALRMTAIAYAVMGLAILYVYSYTDILDGWNVNTIAMIGLFSFLVFTIPFYGMKGWRSFALLPVVGVAYVILLWPTESRSCILAIFITLAIILRLVPVEKVLRSPVGLWIVMLVPLIIAIFISLFSIFGDISGLTQWSYETFNKPLFNGRDRIWWDGFTRLFQHPLFGTGNNNNFGYWHNSAMACLAAYGIVGYYFWIKIIRLILWEGVSYLEDVSVLGSMAVFAVLYCHQSVELGIFAVKPSLLPYVILGILLGRINYLRGRKHWQK